MDAIAVRRVVVGAIVVLLVALAALLVFVFVILPRLGLSPETWGKNAQEAPSTPTEKADYLDNLSAQSSTSLPAGAPQTAAQVSGKAKTLNTLNTSETSDASAGAQLKIDLLNSLNKNK